MNQTITQRMFRLADIWASMQEYAIVPVDHDHYVARDYDGSSEPLTLTELVAYLDPENGMTADEISEYRQHVRHYPSTTYVEIEDHRQHLRDHPAPTTADERWLHDRAEMVAA